MRDYKKVQIQLENLETSVRDRCKKEFTGRTSHGQDDGVDTLTQPHIPHLLALCSLSSPQDLMTEMMDMSSDLVGSGIPFLDYRAYAERIFFPGHQESPLRRDLDVPESRRQTVEQGLVQLSNLLNSKLFLTKVGEHSGHGQSFSLSGRSTLILIFPTSVHPHSGGPAYLLAQGPSLCGLTAHSGPARQAGVLHGHPQDAAQPPGGAVRGQESQVDAEEVRTMCLLVRTGSGRLSTLAFDLLTVFFDSRHSQDGVGSGEASDELDVHLSVHLPEGRKESPRLLKFN